jgi:PAS domain S-box-containing protein
MDVTERNKAHIALAASEARLRDLFDSAPVGYYEVDTAGRIALVNRTALDMLSYRESEMLDVQPGSSWSKTRSPRPR